MLALCDLDVYSYNIVNNQLLYSYQVLQLLLITATQCYGEHAHALFTRRHSSMMQLEYSGMKFSVGVDRVKGDYFLLGCQQEYINKNVQRCSTYIVV